jgi:hypothetical protein
MMKGDFDAYKVAKATHKRRIRTRYTWRWETFAYEDPQDDDWCTGSDRNDPKTVLYRLDKYWYQKRDDKKILKKLKKRLRKLAVDLKLF